MRTVLLGLLFVSTMAHAAAPFPQTFLDVRAPKFTNENLDYYRNKDLGLQTVDYYWDGGKEYIAGTFNDRVRPYWDGYINLSEAEFRELYFNKGQWLEDPRQISVTVKDGVPAYSVIFKRAEAGYTPRRTIWDIDDIRINDYIFTYAHEGYSMIDYAQYWVNGVRLHAAIFQKDDYKRMLYTDYTKEGMEALQVQQNAQGWWIRAIAVTKKPDGTENYTAIFHWGADKTEAHFKVSGEEFKRLNDEYNSRGWYLMRIAAHGKGVFSGVWSVSVLP